MKSRAALVFGACLAMMWFTAPVLAQLPGNVSPRQLVVSKISTDLSATPATVLIEGDNFGLSPSVEMGAAGGGLVEIEVVSATDTAIVANLPTTDPGSYFLHVSRGRGARQNFSSDFTIGRRAGPVR